MSMKPKLFFLALLKMNMKPEILFLAMYSIKYTDSLRWAIIIATTIKKSIPNQTVTSKHKAS